MEGYNLSSVNEVKAVARLSQSGSATAQVGDWEAVAKLIQLDSIFEKIQLEIVNRRLK
jgi:hypothetical protein